VLAHAQRPICSPCAVLKCPFCMIPTCVGCITQVQASFFGVGAPEAVLVGLVALVIFGPQGLAEVLIENNASSCDVCCVRVVHSVT
jgi:mttA/Hcf106 family